MPRAEASTWAAAVAAATWALAAVGPPGSAAAGCDYASNVAVDVVQYIYPPNYPASYAPGTQCRWRAFAPSGARLKLSCNLHIPASANCYENRIRVSLSGDDSLNDAHVYCGEGEFSLLSDDTRLTMVLESSSRSSSGTFFCNITSVTTSCMCGIKKQTRIVGGQETGVNEFPFMAGLVNLMLKEISCGATIVSSHFAATAAHCLLNIEVSQMRLLVGEHDITTGTDTNATKLYRVASFHLHPYYNQNQLVEDDNDIALVRVEGQIAMSKEVMPACLPIRYRGYYFTGQKVEVLGWGTSEFGGSRPDALQKAELFVQSPAQCSAAYGSKVSTRQMCSFARGKDACQADSGGPVLWQDLYTGRVHLVGIVSHGIACATDQPGVNTRVTVYLDFITSIIGQEDYYCVV